MALVRFGLLKNLQKKAKPSLLMMPQSCCTNIASDGALMTRTLAALQNRSMGTQTSQEAPKASSSEEKEVAVQEGGRGRKFSLFPRRNRRRSLWRSQDRDFSPPPLPDLFPRELGQALMQATENINRLFDNINNTISPFQLSGRIREKDDHYNLKYNVPGLSKEDLKVTVHDGFLEIRGKHKEEHNDDEEDEYWSEASYYNTSLLLPDDVKADEIKAELKDGVLTLVIPRTEKPNMDHIKEVEIH